MLWTWIVGVRAVGCPALIIVGFSSYNTTACTQAWLNLSNMTQWFIHPTKKSFVKTWILSITVIVDKHDAISAISILMSKNPAPRFHDGWNPVNHGINMDKPSITHPRLPLGSDGSVLGRHLGSCALLGDPSQRAAPALRWELRRRILASCLAPGEDLGIWKQKKCGKITFFFGVCVCVTFEEQEIYEDSMNSTLCSNQAKWWSGYHGDIIGYSWG